MHLAGALLLAGKGWHASSWSALVAHGVPVYAHSLGRIHLTRDAEAYSHRASTSAVRIERPLHGEEMWSPTVSRWGIPTVGVSGALCDFARTARFVSAVTAADNALHKGFVRAEEFRQFARLASGRGAGRLRKVAEFSDGRVESPGESRLRVLVREMGFRGIPQLSIRDGDGPEIYRADLFIEVPGSRGLILEYDGRQKFSNVRGSSQWTEFERQASRDRGLAARGYRVMHVTAQDLADPALLKSEIRTRLQSPV